MARRKKSNRDAWTGTMLGGLGAALLAGLGALLWLVGSPSPPNRMTNCPQAGPSAVHVIMIDRSDPITPSQVQYVQQHLDQVKRTAAINTRLDIYSFTGGLSDRAEPVFSLCVPLRPADADPLTHGPKKVQALWDQFSNRFDAEFSAQLAGGSMPNSPILESLRGAAQTAFGSHEQGTMPLKLTLVSDLVQNTKSISHLRAVPDFAALARSNLWSTMRPELKGAEVEVLYLLRPNALRGHQPVQNIGHQKFWEEVIGAGGGVPVAIRPVGGIE